MASGPTPRRRTPNRPGETVAGAPQDDIALCGEEFRQLSVRFGLVLSCCSSIDEYAARLTSEPLVRVLVQIDEFGGRGFRQVDALARLRLAVGNPIDAARRAMHAGRIVAFAGVAPVI